MFPRAADGAQLVDGLPRGHEALVPSPAPHESGVGVQVCNSALRRWGQEGAHIQGNPRLAWATGDFQRQKQRKKVGDRARVGTATAFYTGLPLPAPLLCHSSPGSLEEAWHPHQLVQPLPPREI